jgi:branched-chain amino acid transport system substrate-binding protein
VVGGALTALVLSAGSSRAASSASTNPDWGPPPPGGYITNLVKYVHGTGTGVVTGKANPNLKPVLIGWSSNDGGGTIVAIGPTATSGALAAVKWMNTYAGGVDGHPIQLVKCDPVNAEEEGLACAEQFLRDKVSLITFGGLAVGAQTIDQTINGKIPTIIGFSASPANALAKNFYSMYTAAGFAHYPIGEWAKTALHAKSCAIVEPNEPGEAQDAAGAVVGCEAAGLKAKVDLFDPTSTDLLSAYEAVGAQTAGVIIAWPSTPAQCVSSVKALDTLKVNPAKVDWNSACDEPSTVANYPGGKFPVGSWISNAQSGDATINDPTGLTWKAALTQVGGASHYLDPWWSAMWGQVLTLGQMLNNIGVSKVSSSSILGYMKKWKGPALLGPPVVDCGEFKFAPGYCAYGNYYFKALPNGQFTRSGWYGPAPALVKALKALPAGTTQPTSWPFK